MPSKHILSSDIEVFLLSKRSIIQLLKFQTNESFFFCRRKIHLLAIDSNDSIEILNDGIASGEIAAEQMKQSETGGYFLMDITPQ